MKVGDLHLQNQSKVNVFFDAGSQRTCISNDLKNYLNLPVLQNERILIKVFRTEDTRVKNVDILYLRKLLALPKPLKLSVRQQFEEAVAQRCSVK